jgi:LysR family transcriptional regulator, positive regulator for ilvC
METKSLQVFLSVADTLSFSRSAELHHMSVSAVSRTVARLEDELGQSLLQRDRRRVQLTSAGRDFREYALRAVTEWQQVQQRLGRGGELAGEISVYCSVTASHSVLAPILEAFRATHPAVEIMLHTGDQADGITRVLDGQDDISVSGKPEQISPRLEFLSLLESPLQFCIPAAACAVRDFVMSGDRLRDDVDWNSVPFIVPERGVTKQMLEAWFADKNIHPGIYAQVAGHEAIVAMVGLGFGVGIAPKLVIDTGGMQDKVKRLGPEDGFEEGLPPLTVGLCSLSQRLSNPLVKAFWDVAGQTY